MCREPKNPKHPYGCKCTGCRLGANEQAKPDPMRILESLTPGGSEYHNDPERCAAYIRDCRNRASKLIARLIQQRNTYRDACQKAYTCRASMNSAVISVIEEALWPGETKPHEIGDPHA